MVFTIAGLVCLIGLLVYLLTAPDKPKVAEVGRLMFGIGLLCVLWNLGTVINILPTYRR